VTKAKGTVFAKKDLVASDAINAKMDGLDIQTVSLVNALMMVQHPEKQSVNLIAGSALA